MRSFLLTAVLIAVAVFAELALIGPANATQRFGPIEISGNLQTQNLVRTPDPDTFQFIQNRNVARIRLDYEWVQGGKFYGKYDIPFIDKSKFSILWRGVYDSIYHTTPGFIQKVDSHNREYAGLTKFQYATQVGFANSANRKINGKTPSFIKLSGDQLGLESFTQDERNELAFENQLRELYVDLKLRGLPLSIRAGRQQIVWGETDNFRMLDRANSLDLSWHLQQELPGPAFGWDELRRSFWMVKFLYDLGDIASFSQNYLEWYWNPGDWYPAKQSYHPRPWGLPFANALENPIDGAFYDGPCGALSNQTQTRGPRRGQRFCNRLINNTQLFGQGNWEHNPMDNSQVGVRYHSIAPFGLEFTLNYFYQRWAGDDGTNFAPLRAPLRTLNAAKDDAALRKFVGRGIFPAEAYSPYVHTIGASANYSDEEYTQAVLRFETVYDVGIPFFDLQKVSLIDTPALPGVTRKNMWKGMIGFDRPTWIKTLNKKSTFFITGQFFWHYLVNNPDCSNVVNGKTVEGGQAIARLTPAQRVHGNSCLVGGLDLPSSVRNNGDQTTEAFRDKIRDWEALATLAIFTFYRGGSIIPTLGMAVDPVNQFNMEAFWALEYIVRDDFIINLAQRYFIQPRGHSNPIYETWGLAGFNAGRTETSLRMTFQF